MRVLHLAFIVFAVAGGFIGQYLLPVVYPPGLTPTWQLALGCGLVLFNVVVYASWWRKPWAAAQMIGLCAAVRVAWVSAIASNDPQQVKPCARLHTVGVSESPLH